MEVYLSSGLSPCPPKMAKDRPINKIRVLEGERPFKFYNPEMAAANLVFTDSRFDQQHMAQTLNDYMQQHHHHQLQHQQSQHTNIPQQHQQMNIPQQHQQMNIPQQHQQVNISQQHQQVNISQQHQQVNIPQQHQQVNISQQHQQVNIPQQHQQVNISQQHQQVNIPHAHQFNYTDDYMAMNQQHSEQNNLMVNNLSIQKYEYDDLSLNSGDSLTNETVNHQQTMVGNMLNGVDLPGTATHVTGIPNSLTSSGSSNLAPYNGGYLQIFKTPNRNLMSSLRGQDPLFSPQFDQSSQSPFSNNIQQTMASPSNTSHTSNSLLQYPMDNLGQYLINNSAAPQHSDENLRSTMTACAKNLNFLKVKKETDNQCGEFATHLSPSSVHSPSSKADRDDPDKLTINLSANDKPSPSTSPLQPLPSGCGSSKDPSYVEKRRKNNESAKRSREARRRKEGLLAIRLVQLENEHLQLQTEVTLLQRELEDLRARLFN